MTGNDRSRVALALAWMFAAGCNGGEEGTATTVLSTGNSQASAGPTTNDAPTTGDDPTGGDGTTGDPAPPVTREVCDDYLACLSATQPEALPGAQAGYGKSGTCWMGTFEETQQCIAACQLGLEQLHRSFPNEVNCYLCKSDADCAGGDACVLGGCRPKTCGDGLVQDGEICDGDYCDGDCRGPADCTPLNNVGCAEDQYCAIIEGEETCVPIAPGTTLQAEGEPCNVDPAEICAPGLYCLEKGLFSACPSPYCCIRYCDTNAPDQCQGNSFCGEMDLFLGVPVYASELQQYLGVCYLPG